MGTNAGLMRNVVRIESRTPVQDGSGEQSFTWNLVLSRMAERLPLPGREIWSAAERSARIPTMFKMRWPKTAEVLPQMRLICRGKVYDIISAINVDGRDVDLLVSCDELVNEPVTGS